MTFDPIAIYSKVEAKRALDTFLEKHALSLVASEDSQRLIDTLNAVSDIRIGGKNHRPSMQCVDDLSIQIYPWQAGKYEVDPVTHDVVCHELISVHLTAGFTVVRRDGKLYAETLSGSRLGFDRRTAPTRRWMVLRETLPSFRPPSGRAAGMRIMGRGPDRSHSR